MGVPCESSGRVRLCKIVTLRGRVRLGGRVRLEENQTGEIVRLRWRVRLEEVRLKR